MLLQMGLYNNVNYIIWKQNVISIMVELINDIKSIRLKSGNNIKCCLSIYDNDPPPLFGFIVYNKLPVCTESLPLKPIM